jgi:transposase
VTNLNLPNANDTIISNRLAPYWKELQEKLLPLVQQMVNDPLTEGLQRLCQILEIVRIEEHIEPPKTGGRGREAIDRRPLARAFVAKAVLNLSDTRALIEQLKQNRCLCKLCGMTRVASEATFSRAFTRFAASNLGETVHQAMVERFVSEQIVLHVSLDATAVEAREKAVKKVKVEKLKKSAGVPEKARSDQRRNQHAWKDK